MYRACLPATPPCCVRASRLGSRARMSTQPQKAALVTGAARGIGLATAKRFLADGWRVALLDIDGDNLARTYAAIGKPDATLAHHRDVADPAGGQRAPSTQIQSGSAGSMRWSTMPASPCSSRSSTSRCEDWSARAGGQPHRSLPVTQAVAPLMRDRAAAPSSTSPRSRACAPRRCASPTAPARPGSRI